MFLDEEELEKAVLKELEEYKDWIVEIPKTQEEFNRRFSLKNNEISIDEVDFGKIDEDIFIFTVDTPKTKGELIQRFGQWNSK